jgi:hypothetical protein
LMMVSTASLVRIIAALSFSGSIHPVLAAEILL